MRKSILKTAVIAATAAVFLCGAGGGDRGGTFIDSRDGKRYRKVTIGSQTWMAENLNYDDPKVTSDICYAYSADSCAKYGRLYDWFTAKEACPVGWHLPDSNEWKTLEKYAGGDSIAGTKLKSSTGWAVNPKDKIPASTDDYGFSALPGGLKSSRGSFYPTRQYGAWWSAAVDGDGDAAYRELIYDSERLRGGGAGKRPMLSVRCLQDSQPRQQTATPPAVIYTITFDANGGSNAAPPPQTVYAGSVITLPGGRGLSKAGFTFSRWNTKKDGTGIDYYEYKFTPFGDITYTPDGDITLYAKWNAVSGVTAFVDSRDGRSYRKTTIGAQTWMAENLNYDDPNVNTDVCYGDSAANCAKYGRLYDWYTAIRACPVGWHLPDNDEWRALMNYVDSSTAGTRLKSPTGWKKERDCKIKYHDYVYMGDKPDGTDDYGFSALPGGSSYSAGYFGGAGCQGNWWSASEIDFWSAVYDTTQVHYWKIGSDDERVNWSLWKKTNRRSVRCVLDDSKPNQQQVTPPAATYTVTLDANNGTTPAAHTVYAGSTIALPSGRALSKPGFSFCRWNTKKDGTGINYDANAEYTPARNVTLYATWNAVSGVTTFVDSRDGKTYKKVKIGSQTWMAENLNYDIPGDTTDMCYDNAEECAKYGRYYNWRAAMNGASSSRAVPSKVQGVCPAGWHLPSENEYELLDKAVGGEKEAGKKLKSKSGWNENGNGVDAFSFLALPGGYGGSGNFGYAGYYGYWWSATANNSDKPWYRYMGDPDIDYNDSVNRDNDHELRRLYSVRCVQDESPF